MPSNNSKYSQEMEEQAGAAHSGNGEIGDQHGGRAGDRRGYRVPVGA